MSKQEYEQRYWKPKGTSHDHYCVIKIGTFREKNFQRMMIVFVAADLNTKRKRQNTNLRNPNTKNARPSPKAPTPKPQTQKSVWHFIHWHFLRGIQSGYRGSVHLKDGTCIAAIFFVNLKVALVLSRQSYTVRVSLICNETPNSFLLLLILQSLVVI